MKRIFLFLLVLSMLCSKAYTAHADLSSKVELELFLYRSHTPVKGAEALAVFMEKSGGASSSSKVERREASVEKQDADDWIIKVFLYPGDYGRFGDLFVTLELDNGARVPLPVRRLTNNASAPKGIDAGCQNEAGILDEAKLARSSDSELELFLRLKQERVSELSRIVQRLLTRETLQRLRELEVRAGASSEEPISPDMTAEALAARMGRIDALLIENR